MKLLTAAQVSLFFSQDLENWLQLNLEGKFRLGNGGGHDSTLFAVTCWLLWKYRNEVVFQQNFGKLDELICRAEVMVSNIWGNKCRQQATQVVQKENCVWRSLASNWIKVNVDRAVSKFKDWVVVGGVVRDSNGGWIIGFQKFVGRTLALNAELWAILHGLQRGFDKLVIEIDCKAAISLINERARGSSSITIVWQIQGATRQFDKVSFQSIKREGNKVADWLAKSCSTSDVDIHIVDVPSFHVKNLLLQDNRNSHNA